MDTSGFYRIDVNGDFQYAPNFVYGPDYEIRSELKATYTYPTPGDWYWFDGETIARITFGLPPAEVPDEPI